MKKIWDFIDAFEFEFFYPLLETLLAFLLYVFFPFLSHLSVAYVLSHLLNPLNIVFSRNSVSNFSVFRGNFLYSFHLISTSDILPHFQSPFDTCIPFASDSFEVLPSTFYKHKAYNIYSLASSLTDTNLGQDCTTSCLDYCLLTSLWFQSHSVWMHPCTQLLDSPS